VLWTSYLAPSEDLNPQVVTGKPVVWNLTLGIALDAPVQTSLGFHRFEPVIWNDVAITPGNVTYPTRNFALRLFCVNPIT
jgi:hypothetical protein